MDQLSSLQQAFNLIAFLAVMLVTLASAGTAGAFLIVRQNSKVVKDAIEKLYLSLPVKDQALIREALQFAADATDGKANQADAVG